MREEGDRGERKRHVVMGGDKRESRPNARRRENSRSLDEAVGEQREAKRRV